MVYRHLYEALIRADCRGRPLPALAEAWSPDDEGRKWRFLLRRDARFWDGSPVTATDVVASWLSSGAARRLGMEPDSIYVAGSNELVVWLGRLHESIPLLFANPDLGVTAASAPDEWPAGTGPYRVAGTDSDMTLILTAAHPDGVGEHRPIRFEMVSGMDPRDVIDEGHDLLVTEDPRALDYAGSQSEYLVVPMSWDRTRVVVSPRRSRPSRAGQPGGDVIPDESGLPRRTLEELARHAVRAEARAAEPPHWWMDLSMCDATTVRPESAITSATGRSGTERIVYRSGDPVARDLAERLVALGASSKDTEILAPLGIAPDIAAAVSTGESRLSAVGLNPAAFDSTLRSGAELAYVVGLPRTVSARCQAAAELVATIPWLVRSEAPVSLAALSLARAIAPLVDTRKRAVVRRDRVALTIDWDGTLLLYRP
ncbi:MAG: hypothetical protein JSW71_21075 [Gemmatimonadota bacterium]|nr:MAG: hypothetical protein JSW71_21075 [Gemmatimonadota bacterium]